METKLLTTTDIDLTLAADILKNGGNVIFPTETVYGLGADASNPTAVTKIFSAKGRPADNPLIVHISSLDMLTSVTDTVPDSARLLAEKFWPGALTIIMHKSKNVPYETTAGLDTVAVRMPSSSVARRLIELAGMPIAAPSANLSGKPSPTTAQHCADDMNSRVDAIIMGEPCSVGVESTVVDLSGDTAVLLRPGAVTLEQLREVLGEVEVADALKSGEKPKSPGLKYKHYSPNAEVIILSGGFDDVKNYLSEQDKKKRIGLLTFDDFPNFSGFIQVSLGSSAKPQEAASRLFSALRKMDDLGCKVVYAPEIPDTGLWRAVRNRLYRAAGENIIKLPLSRRRLLFVCTGNTCRSPMAEAIFNSIASKNGLVAAAKSAGIFAGGVASANSVSALAEIGLNISGRRSQQITRELIDDSDLVLTMTKSHKAALISLFGDSDKIQTLAEFAGTSGDISDPFGGDIDEYRRCRDEIQKMLEKAIEKL